MAFRIVSGADQNAYSRVKMAASATVAAGDALAFTAGYARRAVAGDAEVKYVALEDKVTGAGENPYIRVVRTDSVTFEADTANNTAATLVGTKVDLTDHDTLNDAASATDVFFVESVVGVAADKKVIGNFVMKIA